MINILHFISFKKVTLFLTSLIFVSCNDNPAEPEEVNRAETRLVTQGIGKFTFDKYATLEDKPIFIHTYLSDSTIKDIPIVFVMHGTTRNATGNCLDWVDPARDYNFLMVCPELDEHQFPGSAEYNLGGGMVDGATFTDSTRWSYAIIEPIFYFLKEKGVTTADKYGIYGHSAGSQFVHRFALFTEPKNAVVFVAANAGWYTMTDFSEIFPYGFKNSPMTVEKLTPKFGLDIVVLLGENDTNPNASSLRKTEEAMRQGKHRFERGHSFYAQAKTLADSLKIEFKWTKATVPGVGHSNFGMAPAADKIISERLNKGQD